MLNLKTFDMNLLVIFDALMAERHVTRAARRLGITQPAMTSALNRLRVTFGDELLVRTSKGMVPTTVALEWVEPVKDVLRNLNDLFEHQGRFDPMRSTRTFRIRMSDLVAAIILPRLTGLFREQAPSCRLEIVSMAPAAIVPSLENGDLDIAISMGLDHAGSVRRASLLADRFVALGSEATAARGRACGMEAFSRLPQMRIAQGPFDTTFSGAILAGLHDDLRIVVDAPHWLVAGSLLETTDLVLVTSLRFAQLVVGRYSVAWFELPTETQPFEWNVYWNRRHDAEPGSLWLRSAIQALGSGLSATAGTPEPG